MPTQGKAWWRVDIGTYCSWLPGDERGFRNRDHRIHSSGDYKRRPPPEEHKGLRNYNRARHPQPVTIPRDLRLKVATKIADVLLKLGHRVLVVSCADRHSHAVAELPIERARIQPGDRHRKMPIIERDPQGPSRARLGA